MSDDDNRANDNASFTQGQFTLWKHAKNKFICRSWEQFNKAQELNVSIGLRAFIKELLAERDVFETFEQSERALS